MNNIILVLKETETEAVVEMKNGCFLHMKESDYYYNHYIYKIYDDTYQEVDNGNLLANFDFSLTEACNELINTKGFIPKYVLKYWELDDFFWEVKSMSQRQLLMTKGWDKSKTDLAVVKLSRGYLTARSLPNGKYNRVFYDNTMRPEYNRIVTAESLLEACTRGLICERNIIKVLTDQEVKYFFKELENRKIQRKIELDNKFKNYFKKTAVAL